MLVKLRLLLAWASFIAMTCLFLGLLDLPVARIQLFPALLAANFVVVLGILISAVLFSRVYCSMLCPLGIFQDMISSFYYLRSMDNSNFKIGSTHKMNVWIDDESYPFMLKVVGVENKSTKFGKISCLKIVPYVMSGRIFKSQEGVTMWVTNDANHVPVEIKAELLVGSLKASLDDFSNVKYPMSFSK